MLLLNMSMYVCIVCQSRFWSPRAPALWANAKEARLGLEGSKVIFVDGQLCVVVCVHATVARSSNIECLNDIESWPDSVNSDRGAVQLLMFAGKKLDITNKRQGLVRPNKEGEH